MTMISKQVSVLWCKKNIPKITLLLLKLGIFVFDRPGSKKNTTIPLIPYHNQPSIFILWHGPIQVPNPARTDL